MEHDPHASSALERAIDQLVDEICERHAALGSLAAITGRSQAPPVDSIRTVARDLITRLALPGAHDEAHAVVSALWPASRGSAVPAWWWATPLGRVLEDVCRPPTRSADGAMAQRVLVG